jgi:hypothetical protein
VQRTLAKASENDMPEKISSTAETPMTASARLLRMAAEVAKLKAASDGQLQHDAPMAQDVGANHLPAEDDFSDIFGEDEDAAKALRSSLN